VATQTPFMEYFKDFTYLATGVTDWIVSIEKALLQNNDAYSTARRAFAITHSWENNVEAISKLIAENVKTKC
jgi:hypothetical protein